MRFTQGIRFRCSAPDALVAMLKEYDADRASVDISGFIGTRLLRDRDNPGHFMLIAEFAEVDGDLTAAEEAERNNLRNETEGWYERLTAAFDGEPEWINFDELYHTGITGNLRTG